ncbi:MAG: helix-turn-helix domain-containing protein [Dehalococcoidia bacterium]|nr:helix-turn-helix domain-containing protein [Dehalococcoidia bacterium]
MQRTIEPLVYNQKEAAKALGISEKTCQELVRAGKIPSIRISARRIIIPKKAIEKILEEGSNVA